MALDVHQAGYVHRGRTAAHASLFLYRRVGRAYVLVCFRDGAPHTSVVPFAAVLDAVPIGALRLSNLPSLPLRSELDATEHAWLCIAQAYLHGRLAGHQHRADDETAALSA